MKVAVWFWSVAFFPLMCGSGLVHRVPQQHKMLGEPPLQETSTLCRQKREICSPQTQTQSCEYKVNHAYRYTVAICLVDAVVSQDAHHDRFLLVRPLEVLQLEFDVLRRSAVHIEDLNELCDVVHPHDACAVIRHFD
jgi:hypothetical protein